MENQPSTNVFLEVHKKSQAVRDKMRRDSEEDTGIRHKDAEEEAVREGFDRASTHISAPAKDEMTQ